MNITKEMIQSEYDLAVSLATLRRDKKLKALEILSGDEQAEPVIHTIPVRTKSRPGTRSGFADQIRQWVANGAPREFTSNDVASALKTNLAKTQIAVASLCKQGDIRLVRAEYDPKRRHIYGKAK